jgi:hypothetical protein
MSTASESPVIKRDLRLDFFRGLALFCIFIDHIPNNIVAQFTFQSLMFADAAEVFILISGYTAGMVYGRAMERQGFLIAALRIYHRVWQLYVAHIFLFMIFMATMAYTAGALNTSLYAEEFRAANFLNEPGLAVVKALTLQFQPAFMDILPLYIVLLAVLPLVVTGYRSWPTVVIFASMSVWLAVQIDKRIALAAWFGWRANHGGVSWLDRRWLFYLAAGLSLAGFLIRFSWTLHDFYDPIPVFASGELLWPLLSKGNLGFLRFANVLALALLVSRLIHPQAGFLASRAARPFVICGRNSLHVFCLGILLSVLGQLVLNEFFGGILMQLAVSAAGIAIMIGVAAFMAWFDAAQQTSGGVVGATMTGRGARR